MTGRADPPVLLTTDQTATLMNQLGYPISRWTLRKWRQEWLHGTRRGPTPLLLSTRKLRYEKSDVVKATGELITAARRAAQG